MNDKSDEELVEDALLSKVHYVVGSNDTDVDTSLSCKITVQGKHRKERTRQFYYHIDDAFRWLYPWTDVSTSQYFRSILHKLVVVSGATHSSSTLLDPSRTEVADAIFQGQ